ncbi:MAG TPA: dihydroorotase [Alphaproteobacteria bacterium]|nr:dihydroorotase [Alphaproteobacteria bacterium]
MTKTAFVNARLLDPASGLDTLGVLIVEGEKITALGANVAPPAEASVIDCKGLCLAPGLVDMRVAVGEPGEEERETILSTSRSAAAGGITALAMLPNTIPVIDDIAGLEFVARRAREAKLVKIFAYGAVTRGAAGADLAEMGLLADAGAVGFTDGSSAIADALLMRRALSYARVFGKAIVQHPEEPRLAEGGQMNEGEIATRLGLAGIPRAAETIMLQRDLRLVELTGGRYHAAHLSTGEGVELIRQAKRAGLPVTCDTAPPYFALSESDVGEYRTFAKLSPPLRTDQDRREIIAGIADGTIDAIASDHVPQGQDAKRLPFAAAAPGVIGLETLLPVALELYHKGVIGLLDLLRRLTVAPADILGLPLGRLSVGAAADLVIFDLDRPWVIDAAQFRSKSKNSPFDARPVAGRATMTVVDGRIVHVSE